MHAALRRASTRPAATPWNARRRWCAPRARAWTAYRILSQSANVARIVVPGARQRARVHRRRREHRGLMRFPPPRRRMVEPLHAHPLVAGRPGREPVACALQRRRAGRQFIPGALKAAVSAGATVHNLGRWSGAAFLRYFGPRPLVEDNSAKSGSSSIFNVQAGYQINRALKVRLDVFNLFDR